MVLVAFVGLALGCNSYGKTCRGQWTQDPWTGETVCSTRVPRRTTTYNLGEISTTSTPARNPTPPECRPGVVILDAVTRLLTPGQRIRLNECVCDCRRDGGSQSECRRACGYYTR